MALISIGQYHIALVEIATSSSLAVFGRHIRLVCLDLMWRFLLSPTRRRVGDPRKEPRNDNLLESEKEKPYANIRR